MKKLQYAIAFAIGLALGSVWSLANAQVEVTASVPCNPLNMGHSVLCMDENDRPVSGNVMGEEFTTVWLTPTMLKFITPTTYWYIIDGIYYEPNI